MQDVMPVKAMKLVAEYILNTHELLSAAGHPGSSDVLFAPFFSFVRQCLTYFNELIEQPAGADLLRVF